MTNFRIVTRKCILSQTIQAHQNIEYQQVCTTRFFVTFVSTTENGWLAFLGPNKRKIVKRRESRRYSFQMAETVIFTLMYILLGRNIPAILKPLQRKKHGTTDYAQTLTRNILG